MVRSTPLIAQDLVREAALASEGTEPTPWDGSAIVLRTGIVVGLEGPAPDLVDFIEKFAISLEARTNAEVVVGALPQHAWPQWLLAGNPGDDSLSVWMVHHLAGIRMTDWAVDPATTQRLASALAREMELPDEQLVSVESVVTLDHSGASIAEVAPMLLRSNSTLLFKCGRRDPLRVHSARFNGPGTVSAWFGRHDDVMATVAAGRRLVTASPSTSVYGAVMTGRPDLIPRGLPLVGSSDYSVWSQFWDRIVPDVYGIQVLGPGHMRRLGDLSRWTTKRLDGERYLVEARDLEAWFAGPTPAPEVLDLARRDFTGLILDANFMRSHPPVEGLDARINSATSRGVLGGGEG